jgi:Carboxypeptidase regulatory-like domain
MALQFKSAFIVFAFVTLGWASLCFGQAPQQTSAPAVENTSEPPGTPSTEQLPGSISGTVLDQSGAVIAGAHVKLTRAGQGQFPNQEVLSGSDGQFSFANIVPGPFQLTITSAGFATQTFSGTLGSGQIFLVPQNGLAVATDVTEVQVGVSQVEVAEEQIKIEEKQRVLGVLPNFYVSYVPNAAPLTSKQKFKLAWKTAVDPFTFVFVGGAAGVEQAQNHFAEYGQGAEGYAKRFGAGYADMVSGTFIGAALLPSLLKQDPRYFYKGTGSTPSRALYAIANSLICKGDNGRWQPNYSNVLGSLAAGGLSNLYYPEQDRDGAGLTFENAAIGIGATAVANLFQEFVIRKLTPKVSDKAPAKP